MPIITKLGFQKNQKRVNVFIDNAFAFSLATTTVLKYQLKTGIQTYPKKIITWFFDSWHEELYSQSLSYLTLRPRSEKEITDNIKGKLRKLKFKYGSQFSSIKDLFPKFSDTLINRIKERLIRNSFLDDEAFAKWFVQQRLRFHPKGKKVLKLELRQRGVSQDIIERIFADDTLYSTVSEREKLAAVAQKAYRQLHRGLKGDAQAKLILKRRLFQRLISRGFPFEAAKAVVDDLLAKE